jgi:hypothetical protein
MESDSFRTDKIAKELRIKRFYCISQCWVIQKIEARIAADTVAIDTTIAEELL